MRMWALALRPWAVRVFTCLAIAVALIVASGFGVAGSLGFAAQRVSAAVVFRAHAPAATSAVGYPLADSTNWSGYESFADPSTGGPFTAARATFVEPSVVCRTNMYSEADFWVGLDNDPTIEQAGTSADCNGGAASDYAWFEMFPLSEQRSSVAVKEGQKIQIVVRWLYGSPGSFQLSITNVTTGASQSVTQPCPTGYTCSRSTAEWITEGHVDDSNPSPLSDFNWVRFSNAGAATDSAASSFHPISYYTYGQADAMVTPSGTTLAVPSVLGNGNIFADYWVSAENGGAAQSSTTYRAGYSAPAPGASQLTNVTGTFVQPSVSCKSVPNSASSAWVGLEGSPGYAEIVGTEADCQGTTPVYYAYYRIVPGQAITLTGAQFPVTPGHRIAVSIAAVSASQYSMQLTDLNTGAKAARVVTCPPSFFCGGYAADWMVSLQQGSSSQVQLAPFDGFTAPVAFQNARAGSAGTLQPITNFSGYGQQLMANTDGWYMATASSLRTLPGEPGDFFSVGWTHP